MTEECLTSKTITVRNANCKKGEMLVKNSNQAESTCSLNKMTQI